MVIPSVIMHRHVQHEATLPLSYGIKVLLVIILIVVIIGIILHLISRDK